MRFTSQTSSDGVSEQLFTLGEIPGVLWTPTDAAGTRPLILMGHGGGQHKKAPGIEFRARRFVTECGFAVVAVDVPGHGDRPKDEEYDRIATGNAARVAAGEELAPLIAGFQAMVARRTVPEWRAVLDAVQELGHVGAGPVGYWGVSLGCGLGVPFVAAEPRVRAAVLGLGGASVPESDSVSVSESESESESAAGRVTVPVEFLVQWDDERVPRAASLALFDALASAEKTLHANPGKHGEIPAFEGDSTLRFFTRHLS
ncbi:alpha/beta hydrolase [Streptomyces sp. LHD-70]|uniref:alpha/beta hydrolase family protein n=1 Tax=Streptomyces sp. LHD-70 TaxID=3072140 RepID=UPI00280E7EAE|nr:alpha/beta hydrolase [Streptomyces sp. LHD-70]MDQ8702825.1 alpha/beta hydrolase [Streptomyces sp. LHD-70]